jgi:ribosomal protein S18 acetylase RimI-like enzyme
VAEYRTFRNTDPPGLVEVWNDTFTGRGAVRLPSSSLLERHLFAKPTFDPAGLVLAWNDGACVGFACAGTCPGEGDVGVTALVGVRPAFQRRGIGRELLRRCEEYLTAQGARLLHGGGHGAACPLTMGLYGGSEPSGFLCSDPAAEPFFVAAGYRIERRRLVLQRALDEQVRFFDPRFAVLRQRFEVQFGPPRSLQSWRRECLYGAVDPLQAVVTDRQSGAVAGRALVWDMEGFSLRWQRPAAGILDFVVEPPFRRQGLAKYFMVHVLRLLQEQFFAVAEMHLDAHADTLGFLQQAGFAQVDTGQIYVKDHS